MVNNDLPNNGQADVKGVDNKGVELDYNEIIAKSVSSDTLGVSPGGAVEKVGVKRTVGLVGSVSLIVGTMIGSGIFASASSVAGHSGSVGLSLVIWTASGAIAMLGALCYIELGLMIPESGGEYSYLRAAFGDLPAFLFVYVSNILLKPASVAAIVLASGEYVVEPFYGLQCSTHEKMIAAKLFSAFFLGLIVFVNCASVRWATKVQIIFTGMKLIAIAGLIITGIVQIARGNTSSFENTFENSTDRISKIGYAFFGGLWAYDGWNNLNYCTEEMKNPVRDLPLSILIGIPLVTGCYVFVNIAYYSVLSSIEVATSNAVAVTLGQQLYGSMAWIVPILVACSTFGAANGVAFTGGRLVYVSARAGHMPELLAMVHTKRHTPLPALIFTCIVSWLLLIPEASNFELLINSFNFAAWVFYGATFASLIWLRYKRPDMKRPYKVWLICPAVLILVSIYLVIAPFADYPWESFYCTLFILTGIPFYLCFVKFKLQPQWFQKAFDYVTYNTQLLTQVEMPESEDILSV